MASIRAARQEKTVSFPCRWMLEELVNNDNKKQQSNRHTNKYMKKKISQLTFWAVQYHIYIFGTMDCVLRWTDVQLFWSKAKIFKTLLLNECRP